MAGFLPGQAIQPDWDDVGSAGPTYNFSQFGILYYGSASHYLDGVTQFDLDNSGAIVSDVAQMGYAAGETNDAPYSPYGVTHFNGPSNTPLDYPPNGSSCFCAYYGDPQWDEAMAADYCYVKNKYISLSGSNMFVGEQSHDSFGLNAPGPWEIRPAGGSQSLTLRMMVANNKPNDPIITPFEECYLRNAKWFMCPQSNIVNAGEFSKGGWISPGGGLGAANKGNPNAGGGGSPITFTLDKITQGMLFPIYFPGRDTLRKQPNNRKLS